MADARVAGQMRVGTEQRRAFSEDDGVGERGEHPERGGFFREAGTENRHQAAHGLHQLHHDRAPRPGRPAAARELDEGWRRDALLGKRRRHVRGHEFHPQHVQRERVDRPVRLDRSVLAPGVDPRTSGTACGFCSTRSRTCRRRAGARGRARAREKRRTRRTRRTRAAKSRRRRRRRRPRRSPAGARRTSGTSARQPRGRGTGSGSWRRG